MSDRGCGLSGRERGEKVVGWRCKKTGGPFVRAWLEHVHGAKTEYSNANWDIYFRRRGKKKSGGAIEAQQVYIRVGGGERTEISMTTKTWKLGASSVRK